MAMTLSSEAPTADTHAARLFGALGSPLRYQLLRVLLECGESRSTNELMEACPCDPGTVHYHMRLLERAGMVICVGKGSKTLTFTANPAGIAQAQRLLGEMLANKEATQ